MATLKTRSRRDTEDLFRRHYRLPHTVKRSHAEALTRQWFTGYAAVRMEMRYPHTKGFRCAIRVWWSKETGDPEQYDIYLGDSWLACLMRLCAFDPANPVGDTVTFHPAER